MFRGRDCNSGQKLRTEHEIFKGRGPRKRLADIDDILHRENKGRKER